MDDRYGSFNSPLRILPTSVCQFPFDDAVETLGNLERSVWLTKPTNYFFCVNNMRSLQILNLYNSSRTWNNVRVRSAILDPTGTFLAVKFRHTVRIFETGHILKITMDQSYHPDAEQRELMKKKGCPEINVKNLGIYFVFWKWISAEKIALVTVDAVYHWNAVVQGESPPVKIFDRSSDLAGYKIFDYRTDAKQNWLLLIGHSTEQDRVVGKMQLFSVENQQHNRVFDGQIAAFAEFTLEGNSEPSTLLCYAARNGEVGQLFIEELGTPLGENKRFEKQTSEIPFLFARDFPIGMEVNLEQGVIFLMTRCASIHFYDLETGTCCHSLFYRPDYELQNINILFAVSHVRGILGLDRNGNVFYFRVDEENFVGFIRQRSTELAMKMARRNNWTGAEDLFIEKFNRLLNERKYVDAIKVAIRSPNGFLRTNGTFQILKDVRVSGASLMKLYFRILRYSSLQNNDAEKEESLRNPAY